MGAGENTHATPADQGGALRIFISYRRDDAPDAAGRLYDALVDRFGSNVFMDVDTIEPGLDFEEVLHDAVGSCDVLIALIGKGWLSASDAKGRRRLDDPEDFVRLEIEAALNRDVRVIPVLLHGVRMPASDVLPESLATLARRNALEVDYARWRDDVQRLLQALDRIDKTETERAKAERRASEEAEWAEPDRAEAERQAREEAKRDEAERAEAKEQQDEGGRRPTARLRNIVITGVAAAVAASLVIGFFVTRSPQPNPASARAAGCSEVEDVAEFPSGRDEDHIPPAPPLSSYPSTPPASGPHADGTVPAGVYTAPPDIYAAIHSLEHGAVIIWHRPNVSGAELESLRSFYRNTSENDHLIVAPYDYPGEGPAGRLPADREMVMVFWRRLQSCASLSLEAAMSFVDKYRSSGGVPEPGAPI